MKMDELKFLGMENPAKELQLSAFAKAETNSQRRKLLQVQFEEEYRQSIRNTKDK